jgi:hypothetical protein
MQGRECILCGLRMRVEIEDRMVGHDVNRHVEYVVREVCDSCGVCIPVVTPDIKNYARTLVDIAHG